MVDWLPFTTHNEAAPRVLVIEDDPHCLRLFVDALEFDGCEVLALPSDRNARPMIERWKPDVVICDLMLQGAPRGLALFNDLLHDQATANISLILCSAAIELVQSELPHLQYHNVSLLIKPFELYELSALVGQTVQVPRLRAREVGGV